MIALHQPPQGAGVALDPVGAADDQHGAFQHLKGALHLGGEVRVAWGVHQDQFFLLPQGQQGLLGEDGDAPLPLQLVGVQIGVPVVHPAKAAQLAPGIEQGLVQSGLARVHVGHHAHAYVFRCHNHLSLPQIISCLLCQLPGGSSIPFSPPGHKFDGLCLDISCQLGYNLHLKVFCGRAPCINSCGSSLSMPFWAGVPR